MALADRVLLMVDGTITAGYPRRADGIFGQYRRLMTMEEGQCQPISGAFRAEASPR